MLLDACWRRRARAPSSWRRRCDSTLTASWHSKDEVERAGGKAKLMGYATHAAFVTEVRMSGGATPLFLAVEKGPAAVARLLLRWGADPEIPREDGETVFTAHFESLVDARALLAENYLSAGAPFDYDADDAERLEREQAPFRPFPPLWVRFLRVVGAALLVVLIQADWTQRKLRDYFLRPLARITNRVSPRGYQTYDWEE